MTIPNPSFDFKKNTYPKTKESSSNKDQQNSPNSKALQPGLANSASLKPASSKQIEEPPASVNLSTQRPSAELEAEIYPLVGSAKEAVSIAYEKGKETIEKKSKAITEKTAAYPMLLNRYGSTNPQAKAILDESINSDLGQLKTMVSDYEKGMSAYQLEGDQLKQISVDAPFLRSQWPKNVQVASSTNQNTSSIFRNNVPHLIDRMRKTNSLTEATIDMANTASYVTQAYSDKPVKGDLPLAVTPLVSTNTTVENAIWKRNDPTVQKRIMVMIEDEFKEPIQNRWALEDREQFQQGIQENYGTKERPVEFVLLKGKTKKELEAAVAEIGKRAATGTEVAFRITAHGTTTEKFILQEPDQYTPSVMQNMEAARPLQGFHEGMVLFSNGETLDESEFKEWLKPFSAANGIMLMLDSCYSGAWIAKQDGNIDPNKARFKPPGEGLTIVA
jgi:hypothetical protein